MRKESRVRPGLVRAMPEVAVCLLAALACAGGARADSATNSTGQTQTMQEMEVIGVTPVHGIGLPANEVPTNVISATGKQIEKAQSIDLSDFLNRNLGSVTINASQANVLQPDVQYRGFTASPLLGMPEGLAVYQDGMRLNEAFGDTVNWDLIPQTAISSINLIGGANPLFGLNTLGGALSIQTKNGFNNPGTQAELSGGSFDRATGSIQSGGNNGTLGYYFTTQYFHDNGFRPFSTSRNVDVFGKLSYRSGLDTADLSVATGHSTLSGVQATPIQLLELSRSAIFTAPDYTTNDMTLVNAEATHWLNENIMISAEAYFRDYSNSELNSNGGVGNPCPAGSGVSPAFLCDGSGTPLTDQFGNFVSSIYDASNGVNSSQQRTYGGTLQTTFLQPVFGHDNQLILGANYVHGLVNFLSGTELAQFGGQTQFLGGVTNHTGLYLSSQNVNLDTSNRSLGVFFTDTYSLTHKLALTISGRYNSTRIVLQDNTGTSPGLNGRHEYNRFNPAVGLTYQWRPQLNFYGSYSESNRAPTAVELSCADPNAPCNLPNAFLSDPPLKQVVAKSWAGGVRGELGKTRFWSDLHWHLGLFRTTNVNDIIFQNTAATISSQGFFANVGNTRRQGVEVGLSGRTGASDWYLHYTYLDATFETGFLENSPNNPYADANGNIYVPAGSQIPGLPAHTLKAGADYHFTPAFTAGAELVYNSSQYYRGDEANKLNPVDGYAIVNLLGQYRFTKHITGFARIANLFDTNYNTFGILGDPTEVLPQYTNPRFLSPGEPRAGWVGVRITL